MPWETRDLSGMDSHQVHTNLYRVQHLHSDPWFLVIIYLWPNWTAQEIKLFSSIFNLVSSRGKVILKMSCWAGTSQSCPRQSLDQLWEAGRHFEPEDKNQSCKRSRIWATSACHCARINARHEQSLELREISSLDHWGLLERKQSGFYCRLKENPQEIYGRNQS